jgi:hypothetical protein
LLSKEFRGTIVLHHVLFSGNIKTFGRTLKWANEQLTKDELSKGLLAEDNNTRTAWYLAVKEGEAEVLDKLWEWAKGVLIKDELNNELLLANDDEEMSALHHVALSGKIQVLEKILKWANQQLTKEVLIKLLLAQNNQRQSACHVAKWLG